LWKFLLHAHGSSIAVFAVVLLILIVNCKVAVLANEKQLCTIFFRYRLQYLFWLSFIEQRLFHRYLTRHACTWLLVTQLHGCPSP
jgi:hypothetical protein